MLSLYVGNCSIPVNAFKFPAKETGISFTRPTHTETYFNGRLNALITLNWEGNDDLINLCFLVDALRREYRGGILDIALSIPYFPYARQDRVCNKGESHSVKVVADLINSLGFHSVYVVDPHSDVLGGVLNNMVVEQVSRGLEKVIGYGLSMALVSPDAGANKKVLGYAKQFGGLPVIRADKTRDTKTGQITGTVVYTEHLGNTDLIVIDDIVDGGGTFIPLAQELRKVTNGTISLFVSHGIFTKGVDIFQGVYDNIFVVNNMYGNHPLIKEV